MFSSETVNRVSWSVTVSSKSEIECMNMIYICCPIIGSPCSRCTNLFILLFTINISFYCCNPGLVISSCSLKCFNPNLQFSNRAVSITPSVLLQNCDSEIQSKSCVLQTCKIKSVKYLKTVTMPTA